MRGGNLSGLAWCRGALWAVSDRDDDRIYRLDQEGATWQAQPLTFTPPAAPDTGLPWGLKSRNWAASYIRGGELDFEGITCDQAGNLYIVSEAHAAVLQLPVDAQCLPHLPAGCRHGRRGALLVVRRRRPDGIAALLAVLRPGRGAGDRQGRRLDRRGQQRPPAGGW
ncbi:hypothetical protein WR25_26603 [Diploscapter pachys]|uniref:Phytase-like domain-containing protein n=1 Tax=Diploscapter pachys TaxID=2018661 RepID=A0A2A2KHA1_9BILA|nr:hypothetical protein WR25_26603 [Diploscapter pachys]